MDGLRNISQRAFAAGFNHERVVLRQQTFHQGKQFLRLKHRLAASELDETAWCETFNLRNDLIGSIGLTTGEGVLGVAPGTAEVAARKTDENTRETSEGGLALNGFVEFD
jgi:hypothetical protein